MVRQEIAPERRVTSEEVVLAPTIGGDITRVVELLPGVASADNSAAFNVRGSVARDASLVLDGLELYILDDFEPGSASSGWYINNDRTALMDPLPDTDPIPTTEIPGGRCLDFESDDPPTLCNEPEDERGSCDREADQEKTQAEAAKRAWKWDLSRSIAPPLLAPATR